MRELPPPSRELSPFAPSSYGAQADAASIAIKPDEPRDQSKKPRIRHNEAQLAALNDLYEANEHPSLEARAELAENLSMDPKAVNAWFANKRSATKKKSRGLAHPYGTPPRSHVDDCLNHHRHHPQDMSHDHSRRSTPLSSLDYQTFLPTDSDNRHVFDSEISTDVPRRMRIRPSSKQTEELRKLFQHNSHPSREQREQLGDRIGMKYQSVTNWFQNQRSLAKRRVYDQEGDSHSVHSDQNDYGVYESLPESASFALPPAASHPSLGLFAPSRPSSVGHAAVRETFKQTPMRKFENREDLPRSRRTRPEPYQLEALKKLFARTANPSIEERGALALEIGMDIGKVTNWFRNLRQTARKRAQRSNHEDGDDEAMDYDESAPTSMAGTPMFTPSASSYSSSMDDDVERMDLDGGRYYQHHSDVGSEEDDQEAVTPPPPPPPAQRRRMDVSFLTSSNDDLHAAPPSPSKRDAVPAVAPPRVEDALLLLSLRKQFAHW